MAIGTDSPSAVMLPAVERMLAAVGNTVFRIASSYERSRMALALLTGLTSEES